MELLIKRDPVRLIPTEGRAEISSKYLCFDVLSTPKLVSPSEHQKFVHRSELEDLLVLDVNDQIEIQNKLLTRNQGLWSGYRSALIRAEDCCLYKIKGVAFKKKSPQVTLENGLIRIEGGQEKYSAEFEKQMSDKWNKILAKEGIEPAMECIGYWHYPVRAKRRAVSASIIAVKGDTRLDELFFVIEEYHRQKILVDSVIKDSLKKDINRVYNDLGLIVGQMKKLMDKNNQTWGAGCDSTNSHIGNVVLYPENEKIAVGFVDFDASCDATDYSKSKLKKIQKYEYENLTYTAIHNSWTLREITTGIITKVIRKHSVISSNYPEQEFRNIFCTGFKKGYEQSNSTPINNKIDKKRIDDIFFSLRYAGNIEEIVKKCTKQ